MEQKQINILYIEDNRAEAYLMKKLLAAPPLQADTVISEDLASGIRHLSEHGADLILLDLNLPDSTGLETLVKLLETECLSPVIVMTGLDDEELGVECIKAGADDFIIKGKDSERIVINTVTYAIERQRVKHELIKKNKDLKNALNNLKESRELNEKVIESSSDCIKILDLDGNLLYMSQAGQLLTEIEDISPFLNKSWIDFWEGDYNLLAREVVDKAKAGETGEFEGFFTTMKGTPKWFNIKITPIYSEDKIVEKLLAVSRDITERILAVDKIKESKKKHRTLTKNIPGMVYRAKPDWSVEIISRSKLISGYTINDFQINKINWFNIIHPDDKDRILKESAKMEKSPLSLVQQYRIIAMDGSVRWVDDHKTSFFDADGSFSGIYGIVFNVTNRKEAEFEIIELSKFPGQNPNPVLKIYDAEEIMYCNEAAHNLFCPLTQNHKVLPPAWKDVIEKTMTSGRRVEYKEHIEDKIFVLDFTPIGNKCVNIYGKDITELVKSQNEKQKLNEQLLQSQKMESFGKLAGGIAHDFNNILTAILGDTDLGLEEDNISADTRESFSNIKSSSLRAVELVKQMLIFSRNQPVDMKALSFNPAVTDAAKMISRVIGENISLELDLCSEDTFIIADRGNIDQVIMNLAVNAADAIDGMGKIAIKTRIVTVDESVKIQFGDVTPGQYVQMVFEDTGSGISKEDLARIFEPFFTTKSAGKGTGLGLSVVFGIVVNHRAGITVYSTPGMGTRFNIYFPLALEEEAEINEDAEKLPLRGKGEKILVVEDEESIRHLISRIMEKSNYNAVLCSGVSEAVEAFNSNKGDFALVFSDMILHDGTGFDVLREISALKPGIKFLLASGYLDEKSGWEVIKKNNIPFLGKPYGNRELLLKIKEVLNG